VAVISNLVNLTSNNTAYEESETLLRVYKCRLSYFNDLEGGAVGKVLIIGNWLRDSSINTLYEEHDTIQQSHRHGLLQSNDLYGGAFGRLFISKLDLIRFGHEL
jgi:hypothetical protein